MTLSAVATRYANALADVVTAGTSPLRPQDAVAQLRAFQSLLESSSDLHNALTTPAVPSGRKKAVVGRLGKELGLARISLNFLYVLVDHRRIAALREIIDSFELIVDERLGFARAEVKSARELSEPLRGSLGAELERLTGKRIRARYAVDAALIGGVVARIGSTVYDGSVRGQLESLERRLRAEG
jgi:F-type H+-transporting ATPase subunit delta